LKDDFQPTPRDGSTDELKPIAKGFVPSDFIIREKALNRFFERDPMGRQFIMVEVILKVSRRKPMPINHGAIVPSRLRVSKIHHGVAVVLGLVREGGVRCAQDAS
jgi:hypothetical protein